MELINVQTDNFFQIHSVRVEDDYGDVLKGELGQLEEEHHIKVRPGARPVVAPTRRAPSVRPKFKEELDCLVKQ